MKTGIYIVLLVLLVSCDVLFEKDATLTNLNYDGTGGISCRVNGHILVPKGGGMYGNTDCFFDYITETQTRIFRIGFGNSGNPYRKGVSIFVSGLGPNNSQPQTFQLGERTFDYTSNYGMYTNVKNVNELIEEFSTTTIQIGEINILYQNPEEDVITGTFWFDAIDTTTGKIVQVTDGRFDMEY